MVKMPKYAVTGHSSLRVLDMMSEVGACKVVLGIYINNVLDNERSSQHPPLQQCREVSRAFWDNLRIGRMEILTYEKSQQLKKDMDLAIEDLSRVLIFN
jgi:hypothetical protein